MHAEHADSNGLNDLSGHVLATRSPCSLGIGCVEKVHENALAHELRPAPASAKAGGLSVAQRCGVRVPYKDAVAGECFVDGKPHRTICVFRVHRLPLSALKPCLLLQWFKHPVSSARVQGASSGGSGSFPTACATAVRRVS